MYAVVVHPAGRFDTSPYRGIVAAVFRQTETLDVRNDRFRGCIPTAHMFAYLRIDILISQAAARLATSPPGSALTGQDLHLLGDVSEFHGIIVFTIPFRPAWPGRFRFLAIGLRGQDLPRSCLPPTVEEVSPKG
jgi:hypothetical protein